MTHVENWVKNPAMLLAQVDISTSSEVSSEAKADWWIGKMPLIPFDAR